MNKLEMVQAISTELKEKELKITHAEIKAVLEATEKVVDNVILSGDKVNVLGVKFDTKERKATEKVLTVGAKAGQKYTVEGAMVPRVKILPSKKKALTVVK